MIRHITSNSNNTKTNMDKTELLDKLQKEKEFNDWAVNLGKRAKKGRMKKLLKRE